MAGSAPTTKQEVMEYIRLRLKTGQTIRVTMSVADGNVLSVTKVEGVDN